MERYCNLIAKITNEIVPTRTALTIIFSLSTKIHSTQIYTYFFLAGCVQIRPANVANNYRGSEWLDQS